MKVSRRDPALVTACLKFRSEKVEADRRAMISLNLGWRHDPGDDGLGRGVATACCWTVVGV